MNIDWVIPCRFVEVHENLATVVGAGIDTFWFEQLPATLQVFLAVRLLALVEENPRGRADSGCRPLMDDALLARLDRLHRAGSEFDAAQADRLDRLRNIEPETGRLLATLVRALRPARLLEIGTSNGYSTLWLADAARAVGGGLVSVEIERERTESARANLVDAGLDGVVELRVEDAAVTLARSADGEWGFVLLDAERPAYAGYWPDLRRSLAPGGLVAVDNVLSHADEVAEFRSLVDADPAVVAAVDPIGAGVLFVAHAG